MECLATIGAALTRTFRSCRTRTPIVRGVGALATAVLVCAPGLSAHDMWIEPATFSPATGAILAVRLRVGQDLIGDPVPRDTALIEQFVFEDAAGRKPLVGHDGADPAGVLRVAAPGLLVIGYTSHPSAIELTPEKFNQYLQEEGLDVIAGLRARRNETGMKAREMFSRCAKSLIVSGGAKPGQEDRALGFTLELVAESNPYALRAGQELPVRLTYKGRPLAGALVVAINRLSPADKLSGRTNTDGRVRFRLPSGGMWLVKAVHMIPAPAGTGAQWASFWASLTFELPEAGATGE
jgi:uncharacterized GH25 family protein